MAVPGVRSGRADPLRWARSHRRPPARVYAEAGSHLNHDDCCDRSASSSVVTVRSCDRGWNAMTQVLVMLNGFTSDNIQTGV
jgi:hypothetical protein